MQSMHRSCRHTLLISASPPGCVTGSGTGPCKPCHTPSHVKPVRTVQLQARVPGGSLHTRAAAGKSVRRLAIGAGSGGTAWQWRAPPRAHLQEPGEGERRRA